MTDQRPDPATPADAEDADETKAPPATPQPGHGAGGDPLVEGP